MTLNNKLAFEIWVGIVVLVIVIGGVAGVTLMLDNGDTSSLARTQVNKPSASPQVSSAPTPVATPFVSQQEISGAATSVTSALLGGAAE